MASKRSLESADIDSNKRQRLSNGQCEQEEPHVCASQTRFKRKYYAVWGGPNPGIHFTGWDIARRWIERCGEVKQRSFVTAADASLWYEEQSRKYPLLAPKRPAQDVTSKTAGNIPLEPSQQPAPSPGPVDPPTSDNVKPPSQVAGSLESSICAASPPIIMPQQLLDKGSAPNLTPSRGPPLSEEQSALVDLIVTQRKNVFYTGSAGVGKSRVLNAFRRRLLDLGRKVNVIAPTGRAALDVNGQTTWTYAGWRPDSMKIPLEQLKKDAWKKATKRRLQKTDVLVVEEISMVENHHLERLNEIMKEVRQNGEAFGGVQIVVTGDFCQLPPVKPFGSCLHCGKNLVEKARRSAYECVVCNRVYDDEDKWAFRSKAWEEADFEHVVLRQIFRQRDQTFIDILQKLRLGKPLDAEEIDLLCQKKPSIDKAVKLFPLKIDVKRINDIEFAKLKTEPRKYKCVDNFERRPAHALLSGYGTRAPDGTLEKLRDHRYESHLELKVGMLVVLLVNLSIGSGLVNGSQGTIVGFESFWKEADGEKSDMERILDIARTLDGEYPEYRAHRIFEFMKAAPRREWPVVRFHHRGQPLLVVITPVCFPTELGDEPATNPNYSLLSRTQIPLMAAWAMTVHKSQGMTLENVEVDLSKNFEEGMAYVALSRATSLEGLKVTSFPEQAQMGCNEEVREFLKEKFGIE